MTRAQGSWAIQSAAVKDKAGSMVIEFDPPLPNLYEMDDGTIRSQFRVSMPSAQQLMTGALTLSKNGDRVASQLRPQSPAWAAELDLDTLVQLREDGYTYEATMMFPPK